MPADPVATRAALLLIGSMTALTAACSSPAADGPGGASPTSQGPDPASVTTTAAPTDESPTTTPDGPSDDAVNTSVAPAPCTDGSPLIEDAVWIDVDGRPSLEVTPTALLRRCGLAGVDDTAWAEVVVLAPDADSPGMDAQLTCHILFAPTKDVWHLEPWRPVVDSPELIRTRCNPGGDDPDLPQF